MCSYLEYTIDRTQNKHAAFPIIKLTEEGGAANESGGSTTDFTMTKIIKERMKMIKILRKLSFWQTVLVIVFPIVQAGCTLYLPYVMAIYKGVLSGDTAWSFINYANRLLKQFFYNKLSEKLQKVLDMHLLPKKTFSENKHVGKAEQLEI